MPDLLETTENGITTLTLNRPERLNALSPAMTAGLSEALERLSTDSDVGAIVIAGAGRGWGGRGRCKDDGESRRRPEFRGPGRGPAPRASATAVVAPDAESGDRYDQRPS